MLRVLKIPTNFGVVPQSFCQNQNPVQDQDQDHDITLDFNTRISHIEDIYQILFRSANSFESYCVHSKISRMYSQTDRQADGIFFYLFCLLRHKKNEHSSKGENVFSLM